VLDLIDESIEAFLRARVPLGAKEIDVSFEAPDREWSAKLTRPTVNLFLWDVRRSTARARTGMEEIERDGETIRRLALPTIELRYLITAWTSNHGDERALLAGVMSTILAHSHLPDEFLSGPLTEVRPPTVLMARTGEEHVDVFRALEGQLKPSISMIVVTDVDTGLGEPVGPDVTSIGLSVSDAETGATSSSRRVAGEALGAVGAVVRAPGDMTEVNATGRFLIRAKPGDELVLMTEPEQSLVVPDSGGVSFD
jgi:hypothetical protein